MSINLSTTNLTSEPIQGPIPGNLPACVYRWNHEDQMTFTILYEQYSNIDWKLIPTPVVDSLLNQMDEVER
jgi:hypothetical protein